MSKALLIIDPQNDFCSPKGSLYVEGAKDDCKKLSSFIEKNVDNIDEIYVSLDTHCFSHIFFRNFWVNKNNEHPLPFTTISFDQIVDEQWLPVDRSLVEYAKYYTKKLAVTQRHVLTIWPNHCIQGSWGHHVEESVQKALMQWSSKKNQKDITYVIKGLSAKTEHYSIIKAEVDDFNQANTRINIPLLNELDKNDLIYIAGQALSHCVLNSIEDMSVYISPSKFYLLQNCCSCIKGNEKTTQEKLDFFASYGMQKIFVE
ncbi:MAG: hypothetical protein ACRC5H_04505 [Treponemataceae bacterium]